jgi:transcriptional regulator with XRE-family HTH domain
MRLKKDWTQEELSKKLGITNKMISFYESGAREPSRKTLLKLAEVFGVSVEDLISEKRPNRNEKLIRDIERILLEIGAIKEDTVLTQEEFDEWKAFMRVQAEAYAKLKNK